MKKAETLAANYYIYQQRITELTGKIQTAMCDPEVGRIVKECLDKYATEKAMSTGYIKNLPMTELLLRYGVSNAVALRFAAYYDDRKTFRRKLGATRRQIFFLGKAICAAEISKEINLFSNK